MSIHLVGKNYSLVPEGTVQSLVEVQNELAVERAEQGSFSRLLWIPAGLELSDERQRKVLDALRNDTRMNDSADLLETSLEDLRTAFQERLYKRPEPAPHVASHASYGGVKRLYLMYDPRDRGAVAPYADFFFQQHVEVIHPEFEGEEAEIREYHEENLRSCDGALIFYGSSNECWVRRKLRELQKSAGFGRTKPPAAVAVLLIATPGATEEAPWCAPAKQQFRTHEALVVSQLEGPSPEQLRPFLVRLTGLDEGKQAHGH